MDQSLWQTPEPLDLLHSSSMWIQTVLLCGKHCQTMQNGTVSRLRFCRRSWGLEIYLSWNICVFSEGTRSFQSAGCVRNRLQFRTVLQKLKFFPSMQVYAMEFQLLIFGIWSWRCLILLQTNSTTPKIEYEETRRVTPHQTSTPKTKPRCSNPARQFWTDQCWLCAVEREVLSICWDAVHLWG